MVQVTRRVSNPNPSTSARPRLISCRTLVLFHLLKQLPAAADGASPYSDRAILHRLVLALAGVAGQGLGFDRPILALVQFLALALS